MSVGPAGQNEPDPSDEKKAAALLSRAQTVIALVGFGYLVAVALGVFLSFFYLARYLFSPGGISVDDAISFIYLLLAFLLVLLVAYGLAILAGFPLFRIAVGPLINVLARVIYRFNNRNRSGNSQPFEGPIQWRQGYWPWAYFAVGLVLLAAYISIFFLAYRKTLLLSVPIFLTGTFISYVVFGRLKAPDPSTIGARSRSSIDMWIRQRPEWLQKAIMCVALLIAATILSFAVFLDSSWKVLGIRKENVGVRLSEENFARAIAYASRNGIIVNPCEQIGSDTVLRNVDIPWHKFGTYALIIYPALRDATETRTRPKLRLEPESDDIEVLEETDSVTCEEFAADRVYSIGSSALTPDGSAFLMQNFAWIKGAANRLKVRVVVHRDKSDKPAMEASKSITQRQAESIATMLQSAYGLKSPAIEAIGEEDVVPKRECDTDLTTRERRICEKMNRRIEVFIVREP